MKKRLYLFFAVALTCLATACVEDIQNDNNQPDESCARITETITARVSEGGTKATVATTNGAFAWTITTDKIAVHTTGDGGSNPACYVTSGGASASAAEAGFTVEYYGSRNAFAIYPSNIVAENAANYGQSGSPLDVTLPAIYALEDVSGENTPCPMIADNTRTGWEFMQLCGLLRLTVSGIPSRTTRLEIDFDGKKVWGDFSIASPVTPGTSVIATTTITNENDKHDSITITKDGSDSYDTLLEETSLVLNIPLPVGNYSNIEIRAYDALSKTRSGKVGDPYLMVSVPFEYEANRAKGKKLTASLVSFTVCSATSEQPAKKVIFSPGNLVQTSVDENNVTYSFESVPFNHKGGSLGYDEGTPASTSTRGYFTWNEIMSYNPTNQSYSPRSFTVNGVSGWSVLTQEEWSYLFTTYRNNKYRYRVKDNGNSNHFGILLEPDGSYTTDMGSGTLTDSSVNTVDIDEYIAAGWTFLPGAGQYNGSWSSAGEACSYWTSTSSSSTNAYYARASKNFTPRINNQSQSYYLSVRLARELK